MSDADQQKLTSRVDEVFKKAGCGELHKKAKDCMNNITGDMWSLCEKELNDLDKCICKDQERKEKGEK